MTAPFLSAFAAGAPPVRCSLAQCAGCTFRFFDSRLTPDEVTRLYSGYRGEAYFRERHKAEPWYSRKVNDGISTDPKEIERRNSAMEEFLGPHINASDLATVLDYGGDKGQFIPASLGTHKFVFELSDAQALPGVTRLASEDELAERHFDLILVLGVLEHCSDPLSVLQKVRSLSSQIVVAVPYERYRLAGVGRGKLYQQYLDTLLNSSLLMKAVDFYSTVVRVRWNRIPPFGILKCHEHLNFFNEQSLTALLHRAGMGVTACSITQTCTYPVRTFSLNMLAKHTA